MEPDRYSGSLIQIGVWQRSPYSSLTSLQLHLLSSLFGSIEMPIPNKREIGVWQSLERKETLSY